MCMFYSFHPLVNDPVFMQRTVMAPHLSPPECPVIVKTTPSPTHRLRSARLQEEDNNKSPAQTLQPSQLLKHGPDFNVTQQCSRV